MLKNSKKLVVAIVTLVLTIALATTATFAWFTMNQKVTAGNIDLDVTAKQEGLFFSLENGKDYTDNLNISQIIADFNSLTTTTADAAKLKYPTFWASYEVFKTAGGKMSDVTTPDTAATTDLAFTNLDKDPVTNGFLAFDLHFRSTGAINVALDTDSEYDNDNNAGTAAIANSFVNPGTNVAANLPKVKYWSTTQADLDGFAAKYGNALSANNYMETRAAYAARIAFQESGVLPTIWDPNSTSGFHLDNLARDYRNNFFGITETYTAPTAEDTAAVAAKSLISLKTEGTNGYYEGTLKVFIYLEGRDGDCFNAVLGDKLQVRLSFKAATIVTP